MPSRLITTVAFASFLSAIGSQVLPQQETQQQTQQEQPSITRSDSDEQVDATQLYMRAKLAVSQTVMEGLVTENFTMIGDGAKQMKQIAEAAHWPTTIDEIYQHHSVAFRMQCDKLAEQAERRDLQAAHYTYLHMSTTCIDCHNYVRGRFRVERKKTRWPYTTHSNPMGRTNQKETCPSSTGRRGKRL